MKCQKCGKEMEHGFMTAPMGLAMARWTEAPSKGNPYLGEAVATPNMWGLLELEGYRCQTCRTIMLSY